MNCNSRIGHILAYLVMPLVCIIGWSSSVTAADPLTAAEAAEQAGKTVTVELFVKGAGLNPPIDSEELYSEPMWRHSDAFIVRFIGPVRSQLKDRNVLSVGEHFMHHQLRVTGKVKRLAIDGEVRPAIDLACLDDVEFVDGATWPEQPPPTLDLNRLKKRKSDLRPALNRYRLEPRHQGQRGACQVFALTGVAEYYLAKQGRKTDLSEMFLMWSANEVTQTTRVEGFNQDLLIAGWRRHGVCPENLQPYIPRDDPISPPSERAKSNAAILAPIDVLLIKHWTSGFGARDDHLQRILETLQEQNPLSVTLAWPKGIPSAQILDQDFMMIERDESVWDTSGHGTIFVGTGIIPIISDPNPNTGATVSYSDSEWIEASDDDVGQAHEYPVGYVSGSTVSVIPQFRIKHGEATEIESANTQILVRASGPDGMAISQTTLASVGQLNFSTPLESHLVKYYSSFQINWSVSVDGAAWKTVGTSSNRLYSTFAGRQGNDSVYETVIDLSTTNANGQSHPPAIATAIYGEFTDLQVTTVHGNSPMLYWGPDALQAAAENDSPYGQIDTLLQTGDGTCQAWTGLLMAMLDIQGIGDTARQIQILPTGNSTGGPQDGFSLLLGAWTFDGNPRFGNQTDGYNYSDSTSVALGISDQVFGPNVGPTAQGLIPSPRAFKNHYIVHWQATIDGVLYSYYFDPSYGSASVATLVEWQQNLAGTTRIDIASNLGFENSQETIARAKKIGQTTLDVRAIGDF